MLIGVEVHAVHGADVNDLARVEEGALEFGGHPPERIADARALAHRPPANFSAISPAGVRIGGGATTRMRGAGMPGSIGARRIARTSAATPCDDCQASFWCTD